MICSIVIVYKPDFEILRHNIKSYIDSVDLLLIWQNSPIDLYEQKKINEVVDNKNKIIYVGDGNNNGITVPLNYALKYASENNYQFLMSMDQDSEWVNFDRFVETINCMNLGNISIIGPRINDIKRININQEYENVLVEEKDYIITSGSVYNLKNIKYIAKSRESFFIDAVDEQVCFETKKKGGAIVEITCCGFLNQNFGNHEFVRFFGKNITVLNYSSFRYYYIVRNHIWVLRMKIVPSRLKYFIMWNYIITPPIKVLLFEGNKISKLLRIVRGYIDGFMKIPIIGD